MKVVFNNEVTDGAELKKRFDVVGFSYQIASLE